MHQRWVTVIGLLLFSLLVTTGYVGVRQQLFVFAQWALD